MYFSQSTKGFYDRKIHGGNIPADAVLITEEERKALGAGESSGKLIGADDNGRPILIEPELTTREVRRCTPAQGLVALFALKNITENNVLTAIDQIPDPVQQYTARIGYQRATVWERGSPTMQAMSQLLHLSEEDLDELFAYAVEVQV